MGSLYFHVILIIAFACRSSDCFAGALAMYHGTEDGFWDSRSIVYAEVIGNEINGRSCSSLVRVIATLTGSFDALRHDAEMSSAAFSIGDNSALTPPALNAHVLILIDHEIGEGDNRKIRIPSAIVKFFPSGSAIEAVTGLDDAKVAQIGEVIRKLKIAKPKDSAAKP